LQGERLGYRAKIMGPSLAKIVFSVFGGWKSDVLGEEDTVRYAQFYYKIETKTFFIILNN
jgi:hypothetical protein